MTYKQFAQFCALLLPFALVQAAPAHAFCGVIEETAQAKDAAKAARRADKMLNQKVKQLKRQYKKKLALDQRSTACVGGAVAIDATGKEVVGLPSCTVTQGFCVNP